VISNLFTRDEQLEIISELTSIMKRENPKRSLTHEIVMEYFLTRTCNNLHVVFCFSPVSIHLSQPFYSNHRFIRTLFFLLLMILFVSFFVAGSHCRSCDI